jgi:hypothetical protein
MINKSYVLNKNKKVLSKKMAKRSSGVVLLSIIAFASLGLSGYMFVKNELLNQSTSPIREIWYVDNLDDIYFVTDEEIPNFNVSVAVNIGEKLFISFNCDAAVYQSGLETIRIKFVINGTIYDNPFVELGGSGSSNLYSPISMQYSIENLPTGTYVISVHARSGDTGNWLKEMTLLVYTYV